MTVPVKLLEHPTLLLVTIGMLFVFVIVLTTVASRGMLMFVMMCAA